MYIWAKALTNYGLKRFLVADACFSGSLFVAESDMKFEEYNDDIKSRWALSSGNMEYVADEGKKGHSPFASYLLEVLKDNKRDKIAVSEIVAYVKLMVKNNYSQSPVGRPLRVTGNDGGDYVLYTR